MSHEEERDRSARMRSKPERAPPHWLNPLVSQPGVPYRLWVNLAISRV